MDVEELFEAYHDNADYEETNSLTKCKAFITACRRLLSPGVSPKRNVHGGRGAEELELDLTVIQSQLGAAQQWQSDYVANNANDNVVHVDFNCFRY